jgi:hypothetical protein
VKVWEVRCANINDYSMVVPAFVQDVMDGLFDAEGKPLDWKSPLVIKYSDSRSRGKKKRPVADIATPGPGALVLSDRAYQVLGPFFGEFGQLLQVQTEGRAEFRYFYNVTNIVKCVDVARSEKDEAGAIDLEAFYDINIPRQASVFKDPETAAVRIYTNDAGKAMIERMAAEAALTGIECAEPKRY